MSQTNINKTKQLKADIEKELKQLIKKLKAGTIDRKELVSGLEKVQGTVTRIPWFKE